tara:strand:- start:1143 stop:2141 length:999 start_codon:yes stop_codon:yes gene_type:complete
MNTLKYIFIVGSSRSGTTMMSRILAKHESVYTFNELHFFSQIYTKYKKNKIDRSSAQSVLLELFKRQYYGLFGKKDTSEYKDLSNKILVEKTYNIIDVFKIFIEFELNNKKKTIACFHTPNNLYYVEQISKTFSNAKFVNMVRDNRDVLLSQKNKWKRKFLGARKIPFFESLRSYMNYHPITTSIVWNSSLDITIGCKERTDFFILKFEEFLVSPDKKCKELCDFLGLNYQVEMLEVANIGSSNISDSKEKRIDSTKINKWQEGGLSSAEIYLAQFFSQSIMKEFNYSQMNFFLPPFKVLYFSIIFPFKLIFAFTLNLDRISNALKILKLKK